MLLLLLPEKRIYNIRRLTSKILGERYEKEFFKNFGHYIVVYVAVFVRMSKERRTENLYGTGKDDVLYRSIGI